MQDIYLGSRTDDTTQKEVLSLKYANRHGLIAGATGTGKTVTLQGLAEGFSRAGVPVFVSDVKGDLSGMAQKSDMQEFLIERANVIGMGDEFKPESFPVVFWDLFGKQGIPLRTTIADMGPLLLAQIMELNDTQEGILNVVFRVAEAEALPLVDMKDLRSLLVSVGERAANLSIEYGNISTASIGTIQRKLLQIEEQGGDLFFGEPALDLHDFIQTDLSGKGQINILAADQIMQTPRLYAIFLFWLLAELFEKLPEIGDAEKPRFVFFFDEAHLLFDNAPKSLLDKIEQVVKLIRSKGVGIYFITQNPADIPESVLSQLGNRIQHALRAFTDKQRKSIKLAAQTYRENPDFKVETAITELGTGEALVSVLGHKGQPTIVQKTLIRPPSSKLGPVDESTRCAVIEKSRFYQRYAQTVDRQSAHEMLQARRVAAKQNNDATTKHNKAPRKTSRQSNGEAFFKSLLRRIGNEIGREIVKGIGNAMKKPRK